MSKIFSIVGVGALTLVMGLASVAPSVAAPLYQAGIAEVWGLVLAQPVTLIQDVTETML